VEDLEARRATLLSAPAGRAFLLIADASRLAPEVVARPAVSMHIAACAVDEVSPWRSDRTGVVTVLFQRGTLLGTFARAVLASPQAAWWFGPLDRTQQLWLSRDDSKPGSVQLNVPTGPPNPWERYAQKPAGGLYTSTLADGTSATLAVLAEGVGDLASAFRGRQLTCWRLEASPAARVFEVDGPQAWHILCVRYPAKREDNRLVPDWSAVAQDWDAVHLTLGGLLTAEQMRVESPAGWTQLGGWDCEQTVWLSWHFTTVALLPDIEQYSRSPVVLHRPFGRAY
jgi:hypothetical protein